MAKEGILRRSSSCDSSDSLSEILEDLEREDEEDTLKMGQAQTVVSDGGASDINNTDAKVTDNSKSSKEFDEEDNNLVKERVVDNNTSNPKELISEVTMNSLNDSNRNSKKLAETDIVGEEEIFFEAQSKNVEVNSDEQFFEAQEGSSDSGGYCNFDLQDKNTALPERKENNGLEIFGENSMDCANYPEDEPNISEYNEKTEKINFFELNGVTTDATSDDFVGESSKESSMQQVDNYPTAETIESATFLENKVVTKNNNSHEQTVGSSTFFEIKGVTIDETSDYYQESTSTVATVNEFIFSPTDDTRQLADNLNYNYHTNSDEFTPSEDEVVSVTHSFNKIMKDIIVSEDVESRTSNSSTSSEKQNLVDDSNNSFNICSTINELLTHDSREAEARLLAKRAARAEAREIRMRDLERQQREQEENADRQFDMLAEPITRRPGSTSRFLSSRRSSEDSLEDTGSLRDLRHELKEVEEKFRKAMIANAQLDNDKAAQTYQLDFLKDRLEELEQEHSQLKREHRDKCRDFEQLKRITAKLREDLAILKAELEDRDRLIAEKGLVIVGEEESVTEETSDGLVNGTTRIRRALVSAENAHLLETAGEGSLDVRLGRFAKERGELEDQISHLKLELEEEKNKRRKHSGSTLNGPNYDSDYDAADMQREASKQLAEFKFRAQKAEQDVATLQATVARLESQVIRYKTAAEISEKSEEALKLEKRKIQREAREAQSRAEELETSNTHLIKRLDKLKNAKSALFKDI